MKVQIMSPAANRVDYRVPPAPRLASLDGKTIGLYNNMTGGADIAVERVADLLQISHLLERKPAQLSGGQQQQLGIARALVAEPQLLILDEPTEGIQPNIVKQIGDVILELNQRGLTVLLVEQKLPFARRVADRYCIMEKGAIVASGAMSSLDDEQVKQYLTV